jgi:hypothetical protein
VSGHFEILGEITQIETFATGREIRELKRLNKFYGNAKWRKRKGLALIQLPDGSTIRAELHWYEASGIGRREYKVKRPLL